MRFKELDLIDRVPEELWMEVCDIVQEAVIKTIPKQIWKTQQWPQDWKRSLFIPLQKKGNDKNVQTPAQLHSSHTLAK